MPAMVAWEPARQREAGEGVSRGQSGARARVRVSGWSATGREMLVALMGRRRRPASSRGRRGVGCVGLGGREEAENLGGCRGFCPTLCRFICFCFLLLFFFLSNILNQSFTLI